MRLSTPGTIALFLMLCGIPQLSAKDKRNPPQQDQISVAAHLAIPGAAIVRFTATRHHDRSYIYAERGPGQPVSLLDVTDPAKPIVISELNSSDGVGALIAAAGTAAVSTSAPAVPAKGPVQTIRLMDFSDLAHPKVTQQFENVTAVEKISGAVILLANPEGIWVLTQHLAGDPHVEERYAHKVIYGESMY